MESSDRRSPMSAGTGGRIVRNVNSKCYLSTANNNATASNITNSAPAPAVNVATSKPDKHSCRETKYCPLLEAGPADDASHQNSISNMALQRQLALDQQINLSCAYQKQLGQKSNVAVLGQRQIIPGAGSGNYTQQFSKRQEQLHTQQTASAKLPFEEQQSQAHQPLQQLVSQRQSRQDIHPRVKTSVVDSSSGTGLEIVPDWQQDTYQKIQRLREKYLTSLVEIYQCVVEKLQQHISLPDQVKTDDYRKLEERACTLKNFTQLLHIPKRYISRAFEEKLDKHEKHIINIINSANLTEIVASPKQGRLLPMRSMHTPRQSFLSQSQSSQVLPLSGQVNPHLQLQNLEASVRIMKQNSTTSTRLASLGEHTTASRAPDACLAISTPGMSVSPLLEPCDLGGNLTDVRTLMIDKSNGTEQPIERLTNLVKTMSQKALTASVKDIGSVVTLLDKIAGSAPGSGSITAVEEDLAAMTNSYLQERNINYQGGTTGTRRKRRYVSAMPMEMFSFDGRRDDRSTTHTDSEASTTTSRINKSRTE